MHDMISGYFTISFTLYIHIYLWLSRLSEVILFPRMSEQHGPLQRIPVPSGQVCLFVCRPPFPVATSSLRLTALGFGGKSSPISTAFKVSWVWPRGTNDAFTLLCCLLRQSAGGVLGRGHGRLWRTGFYALGNWGLPPRPMHDADSARRADGRTVSLVRALLG